MATEHAPPPWFETQISGMRTKYLGFSLPFRRSSFPGRRNDPRSIRNILDSDKLDLAFSTSTSPVQMSSMILWHPFLTLMADAMQVIEMRLRLIALGKGTSDEMFLMVSEKIEAFDKAQAILIRGGDPAQVLDNYRKIVAANVARLSG